jgi:hypothetical protein
LSRELIHHDHPHRRSDGASHVGIRVMRQ